MSTDYDGGPVLGGTFPALIWHDFMISAMQIDKTREEEASAAAAARSQGKTKGDVEHERRRRTRPVWRRRCRGGAAPNGEKAEHHASPNTGAGGGNAGGAGEHGVSPSGARDSHSNSHSGALNTSDTSYASPGGKLHRRRTGGGSGASGDPETTGGVSPTG